MKKAVGERVKELSDLVIAADFNFRIWWILSNKADRAKYLKTLNDYGLFFRTSIHAHFAATVLALRALYETRKDTVNVWEVLKSLPPDLSKKIELKAKTKALPIWHKVDIIANNVFAHRNYELRSDEAFRRANVTPDELRELIMRQCLSAIERLSSTGGPFTLAFIAWNPHPNPLPQRETVEKRSA